MKGGYRKAGNYFKNKGKLLGRASTVGSAAALGTIASYIAARILEQGAKKLPIGPDVKVDVEQRSYEHDPIAALDIIEAYALPVLAYESREDYLASSAARATGLLGKTAKTATRVIGGAMNMTKDEKIRILLAYLLGIASPGLIKRQLNKMAIGPQYTNYPARPPYYGPNNYALAGIAKLGLKAAPKVAKVTGKTGKFGAKTIGKAGKFGWKHKKATIGTGLAALEGGFLADHAKRNLGGNMPMKYASEVEKAIRDQIAEETERRGSRFRKVRHGWSDPMRRAQWHDAASKRVIRQRNKIKQLNKALKNKAKINRAVHRRAIRMGRFGKAAIIPKLVRNPKKATVLAGLGALGIGAGGYAAGKHLGTQQTKKRARQLMENFSMKKRRIKNYSMGNKLLKLGAKSWPALVPVASTAGGIIGSEIIDKIQDNREAAEFLRQLDMYNPRAAQMLRERMARVQRQAQI